MSTVDTGKEKIVDMVPEVEESKDVAEKIDEIEVDEEELLRYMDPEYADDLEIDDWLEYCRQRHKVLIAAFRGLVCNRKELEALKDEQGLNNNAEDFRRNYKSRKFFVQELRRLGEKVEDSKFPE